ncbi:MAG: Tad domain-containing protein [Hyphomicrobiaceae bacterium]
MFVVPPKSSFGSCDRGSVAITFGLILGVLMLFVGLAVDIARLNYVRTHMQSTLDAASLAAAKLLDTQTATAAEVQAMAAAYFQANIKNERLHGATITNFTATPDFTTGTVKATVDIDLPMYFARAGNSIKSTVFKPASASTYKTLRLEVAMALDVTGSMNDPSADGMPKIQALKTVAKEFIDELYSHNPQPGFVRVGLLPWSNSINVGPYANVVAGYGSDDCVVDRPGAAAFTDAPPSWAAPISRGSSAMNPWYSCPSATPMPLQDLRDLGLRSAFKSSIDGLRASGGTAGHIGAAWGWYMLSPNWSNVWGTYAARPYADNVQKIIILLTDGMFNTAYNNGGGALVSPESTDPAVAGSSPNQALNICTNIKAAAPAGQAITIYTIGFTTPPEAEAMLKACGGAANFYAADNASQLRASFADIVSRLTNLRVAS